MCRSANRSRMPVSAKMRAISFTLAWLALNIWLAMVATWFCSALGSTPCPCRDTPVRHSRVASWYCSSGNTWLPMSGCSMTLKPPGILVRTIPPGRDTRRSSSVVSVAWLSGTSGAGIVGEIGVVEQRAQQRGLDALDIHHQVGDRAAEKAVRDDDRGHGRERDHILTHHVGRTVAQEQLALLAGGGAAVERRLVVAVVVHAHVVLGDANEPARGVEPVVALAQRRFVDGVARLLLDGVRERVRGELLHLLAVVALADQLRFGAEHVVEAIVRVLDGARAPADAEFLRRDAFGPRAFARATDLDGDVVQFGPRRALVLRRARSARLEGRRLTHASRRRAQRVVKGVHARLRRAMDARGRAFAARLLSM